MSLSRRLVMAVLLVILAQPRRAAADAGPTAVIQRLYDVLLAVMKQGKQLAFDERYKRLAPAISQTFDLGLMTRIAVGPGWAQIAGDQQQRLTAAFSHYTISLYANRFDDFTGQKFTVDPAPSTTAAGTLVKTQLVKANGDAVNLSYLMRQEAGTGAWKVIDVYLSGTVSELATRRSEFGSVLQQSGADGLVRMLEQRTAALRTG